MNRVIDIGLVVFALVLTFMDSPFASIAFFVAALFHLLRAAEAGKTSEGYKSHLVIGTLPASIAFTGVFAAGISINKPLESMKTSSRVAIGQKGAWRCGMPKTRCTQFANS